MLKKLEQHEISDTISQMQSVSRNLNIRGVILTEAQKLDSVERPYLATASIHKDNEIDEFSLFEIVNKWNRNSGWNYKNSFFIKSKDTLSIEGKELTVSGFVFDTILYNKVILCDKEQKLYEIDLKKMDNCEYLIKQIKDLKKPFYPDTKETFKEWTLRNLNIKSINDIPEENYAKNYFNLVKIFRNGKDIKMVKDISIDDNIKNSISQLPLEDINLKDMKVKKGFSLSV